MKISYSVLILALFFLNCKNQPAKTQEASSTALDISIIKLKDSSGKAIDLKTYQGKTVFLNFWATWCGPCLQEMPSIDSAQKIIGSDKVAFILASDEYWEDILRFTNAHPYQLAFLQTQNFSELNIAGLPTTYIFSPAGKLVYSDIGFKNWTKKENIDIILNAAEAK